MIFDILCLVTLFFAGVLFGYLLRGVK